MTTFRYRGFDIPIDLARLTGGGPETWDAITVGHLREYERYRPIRSGSTVLEIGCGVGRDAIGLTDVIGPDGSYIGIDIIERSISWASENITPRHANFSFHHLPIHSQIHNPVGSLTVQECTLPVADASVDTVILQSVFTHMFEDDIVHYLTEFQRVLRLDGRVFASFFIMDAETLARAGRQGVLGPEALTFRHTYGPGCFINDVRYPEGAVGYSPDALARMLLRSSFELDQPLHLGFWSGLESMEDGQDIAVLRRARERETLRNQNGDRSP